MWLQCRGEKGSTILINFAQVVGIAPCTSEVTSVYTHSEVLFLGEPYATVEARLVAALESEDAQRGQR